MQDKIHGILFTVGFLMLGGGLFGILYDTIGVAYAFVGLILVIIGEVRNKKFKNKQKAVKLVNDVNNVIDSRETSIEILKKRYAKGEITKEEFDQMKEDLE